MPSVWAAGFVAAGMLAVAPMAWASPEAVATPLDVISAHLEVREATLARQHQAARTLAQQHAQLAYRLARKRELGFFANSKRRPAQARAAAMSFEVLRRSLEEAEKLQAERLRVQAERAAIARLPIPNETAVDGPLVSQQLVWPTKGPVISAPGPRADAVTGVQLNDPSVHILARVDAVVVCPADATVKRVEVLPAGGYGVVLAQEDGAVSVLTGLRVVEVAVGQPVVAGQRLGRVGRTLDGAPVLRLALWRDGQAIDPRGLRLRR